MKSFSYVAIFLLFGVGLMAQSKQVCNVGCLLMQGPEYQYGDVTFGQWAPSECCS